MLRVVSLIFMLLIPAYWYFVPYSLYLNLIGTTSLWAGVANSVLLVITVLAGVPLTLILGVLSFAAWFSN